MKRYEYKVVLFTSLPEGVGFIKGNPMQGYTPEAIEQARKSLEEWLNEQGNEGWIVTPGERAYALRREI